MLESSWLLPFFHTWHPIHEWIVIPSFKIYPDPVVYFFHYCCHDASRHLLPGLVQPPLVLALPRPCSRPCSFHLAVNRIISLCSSIPGGCFPFHFMTESSGMFPLPAEIPSYIPLPHSLTLSGICSSVFSAERSSYLKSSSFYLKLRLLC